MQQGCCISRLDNLFADVVRLETALKDCEPHGVTVVAKCWCPECADGRDDLFCEVARGGRVAIDIFFFRHLEK